jgi:hypothetical protein
MKITPTIAKKKLDSAISAISAVSWLYSKDPESDFTRERKLPVDAVLRLLLKFSGKSLQSELSAYYLSPERAYRTVPTKSAFTQQRQKLLWEGCYSLFRSLKTSVVNRVVTALTSMLGCSICCSLFFAVYRDTDPTPTPPLQGRGVPTEFHPQSEAEAAPLPCTTLYTHLLTPHHP